MSTRYEHFTAGDTRFEYVGPGTVIGSDEIRDHALLICGDEVTVIEGSPIELLKFSLRIARALGATPTRPCVECQDDVPALSAAGRCAGCEAIAAEAAEAVGP